MSFLGQDDVEDRLDALSAEPELTIFVGAGSSMEVGLPSWGGLLDRLLREAATRAGLTDEELTAFVNAAWRDGMGVLGVGSVVRAALGSAPDSYIRQAVYEPRDGSSKIATQEPGPSARGVAALLPLWTRGGVEVVTTNYDLLLEQAVAETFNERNAVGLPAFHGDPIDAQPINSASPGENEDQIGPEGVFRVRHLHGALARKKSSAEILPAVLGERDFYAVHTSGAWQADWFARRLQEAPCLFVGASMTDANVLRFLHGSATGGDHQHTALITGSRNPLPDGSKAALLWQQTMTARWADFNVDALYPRYYADTAAFLDELARRRRRRSDGNRPLARDRRPQRLASWHAKISKTVLPAGGTKFAKAQDKITQVLTEHLKAACEFIAGAPAVADCHFGLQLWTPNAAGTDLVQWGSSQHAWRDPVTFAPLRIEPGTKWLSVETWCQGTPTLQEFTDSHGTRWSGALGVPITLHDEPFGQLQVAVVTFNVMGELAPGLLGTLPPEDLAELVGYLQDVMSDLLLP